MAKRKKTKKSNAESGPVVSLDDRYDALVTELTKELGNVIISGEDFNSRDKTVIPTTPRMDDALNGGIPEGCIVSCSGPPKVGKTTMGLHFAGQCQKEENGARPVFYLDVEGRLKKMNLNCIHGLKYTPPHFTIIQSTQERILTSEEFLKSAERIINTIPNSLVIIDSFSALCPEKERNMDISAEFRHPGAKLMASFCRKIANVVPVNDVIVWGVQHMITNTSGQGNKKFYEDGGVKISYHLDVRLRAKWAERWKEGKDGPIYGDIIHWDVVTSALGPPAFNVETYHRYGYGMDTDYELFEVGKDYGYIQRSGTWYTLAYMEDFVDDYDESDWKAQGVKKTFDLFKNTEGCRENLLKLIGELM